MSVTVTLKTMCQVAYKGNIYDVLADVSVRRPDIGDWQDAVLYTNHTGDLFVREVRDFNDKFKPVPPEEEHP